MKREEDIELHRTRVEILVFLTCLLMLISFFVYVYFTYNATDNITINYELDFNNGVSKTITDSEFEHNTIQLTREQYENAILKINYKDDTDCYCRFKINEKWLDNKKCIVEVNSDYILGDDFYDNRTKDGYIYCKSLIKGNKTCIAIKRFLFNNNNGPAEYVNLSIEVQGVDNNKIAAEWKLKELPWK